MRITQRGYYSLKLAFRRAYNNPHKAIKSQWFPLPVTYGRLGGFSVKANVIRLGHPSMRTFVDRKASSILVKYSPEVELR